MKNFMFKVFFLLMVSRCFSQELRETDKLASLCKVWGFLKYYHPNVAKGKLDWDNELICMIPKVSSAKDKSELNRLYINWVHSLGNVRGHSNPGIPKQALLFNLDTNWVNNKIVFSDSMALLLAYIRANRILHKHYYAKWDIFSVNRFRNEKPYKGLAYPSPEYRLLALFRFWNIINYYFPSKYLIGKDWNVLLEEMIPKFKDATDTIAYHLALKELVASINDSHAGIVTHYSNEYFGYKWAPFHFQIIDNKAIVTSFYNDSLAGIDDIRYGDIILQVNDKNIEEIIKEKSKYINASNQPTRLRNFYYAIFNGATDSVKIVFERDHKIITKTIHRYLFKKFDFKWKDTNVVSKIMNNNIGYVNMGLLMRKDVKKVMKGMLNTKAIIFDIRNYPNGTVYKISRFLNDQRRPFAKFTRSIKSYPGLYKYTLAFHTGHHNKKYYKGMVILLINENTQSQAEFTCMALKTAPNVKCIGSQTAGADGDVSIVTFPGGYRTYMSGFGVYYPDGKVTQRIGIVPDIEIKPTISGIRAHKDEVLERAIKYIQSEE